MNGTKHLVVGGLFAVAMAGVGMAAIPASVINVRPSDYSGGSIAQVASATYRLSGTHNWTSNNVYKLWGVILLGDGATLNIQPGTIIRGVNIDRTGNILRPGMLICERGSKIYANGTAAAPICMTDEWDNNFWWFGSAGSTVLQDNWTYTDVAGVRNPITGASYNYGAIGDHHGAWGGFVMCGKAFVNWDDLNTLGSGEVGVEGIDSNLGVKGGGSDDNDSNGEVSYFQIRYGGYVLAPTKEINGFTTYGVGRGTKVHHIEVYNNIDDDYEWFGGTVNAKYLVATGVGDDIFDSDCGFRGKNQFLLGVQRDMGTKGVESGCSDKGMEMDGFEAKPAGGAYLYPCSLWANVTLIGLGYTDCKYYASGVQVTQHNRNVGLSMRDNASPRIYNSIVMDFGAAATLIENRAGIDLTGDMNVTAHFTQSPSSLPDVTYNGGATAGMDAAAVKEYLYGDGVLREEKEASIRGTIFYNCLGGISPNFVGPIGSGTAANYDWVSSSYKTGPWISTGLRSYSGFTNNWWDGNQDLTQLNDATPGYLPIRARVHALTTKLATTSYQVSSLDPRAANEAVYGAIPVEDQWLTPVRFCGAMGPNNNWAKGWTTIDSLGLMPAAPGGDVVVGGSVSAPLTGTTSYITNNITTTVTNGVNGIVYAPNGGTPIAGTSLTPVAGISISPVVTYTITQLGVYQLQTTASLSPASWTVLKTFTVASVPVTVNLTDITGATPPNAGDSAFFKLIKQ